MGNIYVKGFGKMEYQLETVTTENRIMYWVSKEKEDTEIASLLSMPVSTLKKRLIALYRKHGVKGRVGLTRVYFEQQMQEYDNIYKAMTSQRKVS